MEEKEYVEELQAKLIISSDSSDIASDDEAAAEAKRDEMVELEWKKKRSELNMGQIAIARDEKGRRICNGLTINYMNMRDGSTGDILWQSDNWSKQDMYTKELSAHIPVRILQCQEVSREINFSSKEKIEKFRLEQRVFFDSSCIEEWIFRFGFVIPGSTNTWQQSIEAAPVMMAPETISGKLTIETAFYDDDLFISKTVVRIFYDQENN